MKTTEKQRLENYKKLHPQYNITCVKKMSKSEIDIRYKYGKDSLFDMYRNPSKASQLVYNYILDKYKPIKMTLLGSSSTFSVLLTTDKGVMMHITKYNNYIIEA